jgi:hypothetical protein
VLVFVAVLLPVLGLFVSFAIDFAHFFDYSRNLQNRADAAVLAAGLEYGAKCFGTSVTQAQLDSIGHPAQQYGGPPNGTPDANLPYPFASVSNYQNQPNLSAGQPADLHLILNGAASWDHGGTSFSEGTFCAANYPVAPPAVPPLPAVDAWITQAHLPLFFELVGVRPNISAHARVQLQQIGTPVSSSPIAVPDPADVPCMVGNVIDQTTGNQIATTGALTLVSSNPPTWTGPTTTGVTIPTTNGRPDQLTVQAFFPDDCSIPTGPGTTYDPPAQGGGIVFVNGYTPPPPTVTAATLGSVWLEAAGCTPTGTAESNNQLSTGGAAYFYYFTQSTSCSVTIHARVDFPAAQGTPGVLATMDGNLAGGHNMTAPPDSFGGQYWTTTFSFAPRSGRHVFTLRWYQSASTVTNKCQTLADAHGNSALCDLNAGNPVQETFAAADDGTDPPDDSGPVVAAKIGCAVNCSGVGGVAAAGVNSIPTGTSPTLQVTFQLQGLANSGQNDPPVVLRASVQSSKATGLVDCGQGGSAADSRLAITNGCPHPVSVYNGSVCVLDPSAQPWTCLHINTGNKRQQIINGFTNRIGSSCDNWQTFKATGVNNIDAATDPRAFTMIITSPNDISAASGDPNAIVHILGFATFYVTGWDGDNWLPGTAQTIPGCTAPTDKDEAFPGSGSSNNQIWGHFYKTAEAGGIGNGDPCDPNKFGDCVASLTG